MATRRKRNLLDTVLADSATAVCVLDANRRLRHFSPGMEKATGWAADKVEGPTCEPSVAATATPVDLLRSALAPTIDVLTGQTQTVNTVLPTAAGTVWRARLTFVPLLDGDQSLVRIIVVAEDDRGRQQSGASLSQKLHAEITALRLEFRRRFSDQSFLGKCPQIRKALDQAQLLAKSDAGYSIVGPVGSGRRHLAKLIHVAGQRHDTSFVTLDCRLLTGEQLLITLRRLRQLSDNSAQPHHQHTGTLALVNAERCPAEVQHWLLEHLDSEVDGIRLAAICETDFRQHLEDAWLTAEFCDLFATLTIRLPPLHSRGEDIPLLAQHFVQQCQRTLETSAETLSEEIVKELQFYRWPGNVAELSRVIVDACQNSFESRLTIDDLPFSFRAGLEAQQLPTVPQDGEVSLAELMSRFEKDVLLNTLEACRGNKADAARRLGMTRPRLYRRLKTLGIDDEETAEDE